MQHMLLGNLMQHPRAAAKFLPGRGMSVANVDF